MLGGRLRSRERICTSSLCLKRLEACLLWLLGLLCKSWGRLSVILGHAVLWYRLLLETRGLRLCVFREWVGRLSLQASGVAAVHAGLAAESIH